MSQGLANVVTLYDKDGNPIQVSLQDNEYRLAVIDPETHNSLDEIKFLLVDIVDAMPKIPDPLDTDSIEWDLDVPGQIKAKFLAGFSEAIIATQIFGS